VPDQSGKVAIVTGANSGIGFHMALELGRNKAEVILACRSEQRGNEALAKMKKIVPEGNFIMKQLDVSSLADVERFATQFTKDYKRLDILINNAGIMMPPYQLSADGFESQLATNHLGPFALTGRLIDLLESTPNARVVAVSSLAAWGGKKYDTIDFKGTEESYDKSQFYYDSKLANQLFMDELARRHPKIVSVGAHPGISNSNLHTGTQSGGMTWAMQDSQMGCLPILRAAVEEGIVSSTYYAPRGAFGISGFPTASSYRPSLAKNSEYAAAYWTASEGATGVMY